MSAVRAIYMRGERMMRKSDCCHPDGQETWVKWWHRYNAADRITKVDMLAKVEGVSYGRYMVMLTCGQVTREESLEKAKTKYKKNRKLISVKQQDEEAAVDA